MVDQIPDMRPKSYREVTDRIGASSYAVQTGLNTFSFFKVIIVFALIAFFIVGPGLIGIASILSSFTWYYWVALLFIVLLWIRR